MSFGGGAFDYGKQFISPLYSMAAAHHNKAVAELPLVGALAMTSLAGRIAERREVAHAGRPPRRAAGCRVDASAETKGGLS